MASSQSMINANYFIIPTSDETSLSFSMSGCLHDSGNKTLKTLAKNLFTMIGSKLYISSEKIDIPESIAFYGRFYSDLGRISLGSSPEAKIQDNFIKQLRAHRDASITNPTKLSKLSSKIINILEECSQDGWNGYDAKPINHRSAENVFKFLAKLDRSIPFPDLIPEPTGDLAMEWEKNKCRLIIGIDEFGTIGFVEISPSGCEYGTHKFIYNIIPINLRILLMNKYA